MMSFSFFFSAAVMAVRVRSLLDPTPHPCMRTAQIRPYHISSSHPRLIRCLTLRVQHVHARINILGDSSQMILPQLQIP